MWNSSMQGQRWNRTPGKSCSGKSLTEWQINSRNSAFLTITIPSFILFLDSGRASVPNRWNRGHYLEKVACSIIQTIAILLNCTFATYYVGCLRYLFGRSFHLAPVCTIQRMSSRVSELSIWSRTPSLAFWQQRFKLCPQTIIHKPGILCHWITPNSLLPESTKDVYLCK